MESSTIVIILATVVLTNMALTLVIFSRGLRKLAHIFFACISLCAGLWGLSIIGFYTNPPFLENVRWTVLTHTFAIIIALLFFYFSINFPQRIIRKWPIYLITSIPVIAITYTLFSGDAIIGTTQGEVYEIHSGYFWYGLVMFVYFFAGYFFLYKQYQVARNKDEQQQVKYVLFGSLASSLFAIIPDLILPYYNIFSFTWLGPIFTLILVGSIFIAIVRYGLFNIKVILTESIASVIIVFLAGELLFVDTQGELFFKTLGVFFVVLLSHLLIKSVSKEIEQRERIEGLAEELSRANTRLKEIDKQKTEFVSFASHQLRSPLTAIKGYASMILEGDFGTYGPELKNAVETIFESSKTLTNVVDDYLNISRIELGTMKYHFEPLNLRTMVETVISELRPNFEKDGVTLVFESDQTKQYNVNADPDKLKQVIANIIDNSMKYAPKGNVKVTVERNEQKKCIYFKTEDNGIGMSPETLGKLFNKFTRADTANRTNIRGTGLGLYVARDIIGAHKGKIWAESDGEGKGSRFIVELACV